MREIIPVPIREAYRFVRAKLLSIGVSGFGSFDQSDKEMGASKDFSVIVPIHDAPEMTARCLKSLENYSASAEVILVNDASQLEENINLIKETQRRNGWGAVNHDKCLGHSQACQSGSKVATRKYLCFLNSDTVVTPWSWCAAKEAFDSDPRIAVTGPSTSRTATKQAIRWADYCRHYWTDSQIYSFAKKYISKQSPRTWVDLPAVGGFAFFIRRSVWEEVGGFDPNLPDYGNESELCRRLSKRGFRIVWTKNSYIHHFGKQDYGRTMSQDTLVERRLAARSYINSLYGTGD